MIDEMFRSFVFFFFQNVIHNSNTIKEQVEAKLIPLKTETDSVDDRSNVALVNIRNIKSQADIHVNRIEKASEIGRNLTNEINLARNQVAKLLEQLKSLQSSLSSFRFNHYTIYFSDIRNRFSPYFQHVSECVVRSIYQTID